MKNVYFHGLIWVFAHAISKQIELQGLSRQKWQKETKYLSF